MGNSISPHIENAQKTGVCSLKAMKLKELPPEISKLPKTLRTLELSNNSLKNIPDVIGQFQMLKTLSVNQNQLVDISQQIDKLIKLETLALSSNHLTSFSLSNAGKMKHLKTVNLSQNRLKSFPTYLCNLPNLDALDLSNNSITTLPGDVKNLKAIELNLNNNKLNRLNDGLCQCERLKVLRVEENCLDISSMTEAILKQSKISLIAFDGNTFDMKKFQECNGYEEYISRYAATKKKVA